MFISLFLRKVYFVFDIGFTIFSYVSSFEGPNHGFILLNFHGHARPYHVAPPKP